MLGAFLLVLLACTCIGCGAGGARRAGVTITDTAAKTPVATSSGGPQTPATSTPRATDCAGATLEALERVGHSVYERSASGRIVAEAAYRLESSGRWPKRRHAARRATAARVLRSLLLNQIVDVRVQRAGRTLRADRTRTRDRAGDRQAGARRPGGCDVRSPRGPTATRRRRRG